MRSSLVLLSCLIAIGACGSSSNNATPDAATANDATSAGDSGGSSAMKITVAGTASPHPLAAPLMADADFTMMGLAVVDPVVFLANPAKGTLGMGPLDTSMGNCSMAGCAWSLPSIDVSQLSLGLVAIVDDLRTSGKLWVRTGTGIGTPAEVMAMTKNGTLPDRRAFAVSKALETKLAAFVSAASGTAITADQMEARGFMIATVVTKLSEGAKPVAGAKITPAGMAANNVDLYYPNDTFTGKQDATGATGTVIVVAKTPGPVVTQWPVTPPAGDTHTWQTYSSGTQPGAAFILIFLAKE